MERYGVGYLEERKLVKRWPQPIPAIVALLLTLAVFYASWWIFQDPRGGCACTPLTSATCTRAGG